jgi:hypothetical protein
MELTGTILQIGTTLKKENWSYLQMNNIHKRY